jgi:hypothetical protein
MAEAENKTPTRPSAPVPKKAPASGPTLIERVVVGGKPFHAVSEDGERYIAQPGETVKVRGITAKNFSHVLVDPKVAAAQKEADDARTKAEAAATAAEGGSKES